MRCLLLLLLTASTAIAQTTDAALRDRVAQLLERLGDDETADQAEESLIKLGPRALPLLPDPAPEGLKERLGKVRSAIEEQAEEESLDASRVTIKGEGIRLSEALRALQSQSGNPISDMRELYGQDATNPALDLDIEDRPFFEALDQIVKQAGLTLVFYTGDGTIGLLAGGGDYGEEMMGVEHWRLYSGPFRIELREVALAENFATGTRNGNVQLEVAWEPRLRPMLLSLGAAGIEIVDDRGEAVEPNVRDESGTVVLRPENPVAELNLNVNAPDRAAQKIGTLKVAAEVTVPAGNRVFRFPDLAASNVKQEQGDIAVTLRSVEVDDFVWKVNVEVVYADAEGPAFESYRQGLFNNRLWLQRPDGSRFEQNGGFNQTGGGGGRLAFQYLFVDAPGKPSDYQFVYETPSKVLTIPLEFEYEAVPLP
ncbi:hypothetical protein BH23PLA1_BH23PLA1_29990 [soil metagenome]